MEMFILVTSVCHVLFLLLDSQREAFCQFVSILSCLHLSGEVLMFCQLSRCPEVRGIIYHHCIVSEWEVHGNVLPILKLASLSITYKKRHFKDNKLTKHTFQSVQCVSPSPTKLCISSLRIPKSYRKLSSQKFQCRNSLLSHSRQARGLQRF